MAQTQRNSSGVGGDELDKMADELHSWFLDEVDALVTALSDPYPFGTRPISDLEQYTAYRQMDEAGLTAMIKRLEERYRGFPDARDRVQKALDRYFREMGKLAAKYSAGFGEVAPLTP